MLFQKDPPPPPQVEGRPTCENHTAYFTYCTNRIRFIRAEKAVFSVALYGCKTWRKQGLAMGGSLTRSSPDQCVGHTCL